MKNGGELFDNKRFGIAPIEVISMHPQQRLVLELSLVACTEAGTQTCISHTVAGPQSMGTFVAACAGDDMHISVKNHSSPYAGTGGAASIISNRLAFVFGLVGPSMTVDTACSSSLVALDVACK